MKSRRTVATLTGRWDCTNSADKSIHIMRPQVRLPSAQHGRSAASGDAASRCPTRDDPDATRPWTGAASVKSTKNPSEKPQAEGCLTRMEGVVRTSTPSPRPARARARQAPASMPANTYKAPDQRSPKGTSATSRTTPWSCRRQTRTGHRPGSRRAPSRLERKLRYPRYQPFRPMTNR